MKNHTQKITNASFKVHQDHFLSVCSDILDMNIKNPNLQNELTARLMGYDSYNAVQPSLKEDDEIINELSFSERYTGFVEVKSMNILLQIDFERSVIRGRAFNNEDWNQNLSDMNSMLWVNLSSHGVDLEGSNWRIVKCKRSDEDFVVAFTISNQRRDIANIDFHRTKSGISFEVMEILDNGELQDLTYQELKFSSCDGDYDKVELINK
ncbi:hypothetical protein [Vibrio harveyi]|uniref:hypothetical protein n=1 Tax=Vibrio harveyi TaxID=669 RepID=UPI003CF79E70